MHWVSFIRGSELEVLRYQDKESAVCAINIAMNRGRVPYKNCGLYKRDPRTFIGEQNLLRNRRAVGRMNIAHVHSAEFHLHLIDCLRYEAMIIDYLSNGPSAKRFIVDAVYDPHIRMDRTEFDRLLMHMCLKGRIILNGLEFELP